MSVSLDMNALSVELTGRQYELDLHDLGCTLLCAIVDVTVVVGVLRLLIRLYAGHVIFGLLMLLIIY